MDAIRRRRHHADQAGFTLVELMVVVVITGILATIGIMLVRGHLNAAKVNRALAGVQAIRVAQEQYRAQGGQYLSCSSFVDPRWYPMEVPDQLVHDWRNFTRAGDGACWKQLGVLQDGSGTQYGYLVHAGLPGAGYPTLELADAPALPASAQLWYVIQVKGDIDGDGSFMQGVATSYSGEVYLENEGE